MSTLHYSKFRAPGSVSPRSLWRGSDYDLHIRDKEMGKEEYSKLPTVT